MNQTVRPAAPQDIGPILTALSPRMEQELPQLLPDMTHQMRRRYFVNQALHAIGQACASTFLDGAHPVCVLAWIPDGTRWATITLATERFYRTDFLRLSKRHLADVQARLGAEMVAHTMSDHPRAAPWLRFLGFLPDPEASVSGHCTTYVLPWPREPR